LSESIGNLCNLHYLDLSKNKLEKIPESIGNLCSLQELVLSKNKLKKIPESIGNLKNLQYLDLSGNELEKIPESIGNLHKLYELHLYDNQRFLNTHFKVICLIEDNINLVKIEGNYCSIDILWNYVKEGKEITEEMNKKLKKYLFEKKCKDMIL